MNTFTFNRVSRNSKTGPIPVTMTDRSSCPNECELKGSGCYAENFPLSLHWAKMANSMDLDQLCGAITSLPKGQLWRHNTAGDLPKKGGSIDGKAVDKIVKANHKKRGFTYTHYTPIKPENLAVIKKANQNGFTINVSANNYSQAEYFHTYLGLPTVTVLPSTATNKSYNTENGTTIVTCPASIRDTNCSECAMCYESDRDFIIGFPAHGRKNKQANLIATKNI